MFALPFVLKDVSFGVRIASASGFLMTLLYVVLSVFPIIEVQNPWLFTAKIIGLVVALQCAGAAYYWRALIRQL